MSKLDMNGSTHSSLLVALIIDVILYMKLIWCIEIGNWPSIQKFYFEALFETSLRLASS